MKYYLVIGGSWLIALVIALVAHNALALLVSIAVLLILTVISYIRKFRDIYKTSPLHVAYRKFATLIRSKIEKTSALNDELNQPRTELTTEQLAEWSQKLEGSLLYNRAALFVARRFREYQNSGIGMAFSIVNLLGMIIGTVLTFAAVYFATYKIEPSFFTTNDQVTFFNFFYFSFNSLTFNSVSEITASHPVTQSLLMFEEFLALALIAILASLVISVQNQRTTDELGKIIATFEEEGGKMEDFIRKEYRLSSIEATEVLRSLKSGMIKVILFLTEQIRQ